MTRVSRTHLAGLMAIALIAALLPLGASAATLEITGPDGASVVVNGRIMGFLPLNQALTLAPGQYEIRSEMPGHQPFKARVQLNEVTDWQRLQIRPVPLSRRTALTSNLLFAGMGQHYVGQSWKGYFFNVAEATGLLTAFAGELQRSGLRKDYLLFKDRYDTALHPDDIERYRTLSNKAYSDMEDMEKLRDTGLMITGGAIALSILDSLLRFPSMEAGVGQPPLMSSHGAPAGPDAPWNQNQNPWQTVHAGFKLNF